MVKIRLRRTGTKKKPSYRVVVADSRTPRDGRFIEILGHYNPRNEPVTVNVQEDRVLYWLSVGAQPTDPVKRLLENLGTLDRFARLKKGADLEDLLAEAETVREKSKATTPAKPKKAKAKEVKESAEEMVAQADEVSDEPSIEEEIKETEEETKEKAEEEAEQEPSSEDD